MRALQQRRGTPADAAAGSKLVDLCPTGQIRACRRWLDLRHPCGGASASTRRDTRGGAQGQCTAGTSICARQHLQWQGPRSARGSSGCRLPPSLPPSLPPPAPRVGGGVCGPPLLRPCSPSAPFCSSPSATSGRVSIHDLRAPAGGNYRGVCICSLRNTAGCPPPLREQNPLSLLCSNRLQMQKTAGVSLSPSYKFEEEE
jgi:hypothetical protein